MDVGRRRFIQEGVLGAGCAALGLCHLDALAGEPSAAAGRGARAEDDFARWTREALYTARSARGVRCLKCPNFCDLAEGETGKCRNRVQAGGKIWTIAYGNPCAVHVDPIEKKPFFHFLPSTRAFSIAAAGCNLRCLNCQNWQISQASPRDTENVDLMPAAVVEQARAARCASIAYTYSEPTTFYEYVCDTAKLAREGRVRNLLKSNGTINEEPLRAMCRHLDAANIDLKSFDDETYVRLSQGRRATVLRTLTVLREEGVWLEITNLVIPGWTDDLGGIRAMAGWLVANGLADVPLHFSRFVPLYKLDRLPLTPVSTLEDAREAARAAGMKYVYIGNVPGTDAEHTYCHACGKRVVERRGYAILSTAVVGGACRYCGAPIPGVWA